MPIPTEAAALWRVFVTLSMSRRSGFGPSPLCLSDVDAFCRLLGVRLTPWEVETLIAVDSAGLAASAPRME